MKRIFLALIMTLLCVPSAHSKVTYLHSNPLGSIVAATDESGNQLWVKRYTPFGTESEAVGAVSDSGTNHGFATHELDKETGLVYMKARYYDPAIGRFLSEDRMGIKEGFNFYGYARNSPFIYSDPTGNFVETPWDAFNVAVGTASLGYNVATGQWGWAALDALGLAYDLTATAVPFLPGGASAAMTSLRAGNSMYDSFQIGADVAKAARLADDAARSSTAVINTGLDAAREGTRIHGIVADGLNLSEIGTNAFRGGNGASGIQPDLYWQGKGIWADLTTEGQWGSHVNLYSSQFGQGIPMIYEAGAGLTNFSSLTSGFSTINSGAQFGSSFSYSSSYSSSYASF